MNKSKLVKLSLLALVVLFCLILIIPSASLVKTAIEKDDIKYVSIAGGVFMTIKSNKAYKANTYSAYLAVLPSVSRLMVVVLLVNIALAGLLAFGELKEKKIKFVWFLLLIVSALEICMSGSSKFMSFVSFLPVVFAVVFKVVSIITKKRN